MMKVERANRGKDRSDVQRIRRWKKVFRVIRGEERHGIFCPVGEILFQEMSRCFLKEGTRTQRGSLKKRVDSSNCYTNITHKI